MKSKTKTILIFAAILAADFLIAFLDGGAVQSAADEEEEGTLIGACGLDRGQIRLEGRAALYGGRRLVRAR